MNRVVPSSYEDLLRKSTELADNPDIGVSLFLFKSYCPDRKVYYVLIVTIDKQIDRCFVFAADCQDSVTEWIQKIALYYDIDITVGLFGNLTVLRIIADFCKMNRDYVPLSCAPIEPETYVQIKGTELRLKIDRL